MQRSSKVRYQPTRLKMWNQKPPYCSIKKGKELMELTKDEIIVILRRENTRLRQIREAYENEIDDLNMELENLNMAFEERQ